MGGLQAELTTTHIQTIWLTGQLTLAYQFVAVGQLKIHWADDSGLARFRNSSRHHHHHAPPVA